MSKYRNTKTNGYASKKEAARAAELKLMEKAGLISALREQVRIELTPKCGKERASYWVSDFVYQEGAEEVWEDCKGYRTPLYILKRKIVLYRYGKRIRET